MRAIIGARTSVFNDDKVSHDAQRETGERHAKANGWTVSGHFMDLGVSATISPFDRESLGPWLTPERIGEYDAVVWSKVDRAFRSAKDCADVAHWAETNGKVLVFVDDGMTLDYRTGADRSGFGGMMAEVFVMLSAIFAQLELRRFRQRASDTHRELKTRDRWASGVPPLGFKTIPHPSGEGKTLDTDPEGYVILHDMATRLLSGESFTSIAHHLNESGARTNMARAREAKGTPAPKWTTDNVKRALTTLRTQGIKMSRDQPVLDSEGEFIRLAEPTFDDAEWAEIQAKAGERVMSGKRRAVSTNPMLGVGYCGECNASLTRKTRNGRTYYRCGRTPVACAGVGIRDEDAHDIMARVMTKTFGAMRSSRQVFVPGSDNSAELEAVDATIRRLRAESDAGLITTAEDESDWLHRLKVQTERRDRLNENPVTPSRYVTEYGEQTYSEAYGFADADGKREILRNSGLRLIVYTGNVPMVRVHPVLREVFGVEELSPERLEEPGTIRLVGNFARAVLRGDMG